VKLYRLYHGMALRTNNVNVQNVYTYQCGFTSIIVKSTTANPNIEQINISDVRIEGTTDSPFNRGGQVHIQSFDTGSTVKHVNISNVVSKYGGTACILVEQLSGTILYVTIQNAKAYACGDSNTRAAFDFQGGSTIKVFGCMSENATGYGFRRNGGTDIKLYGCGIAGSGVSDINGTFDATY
jgi:hypothetical protein